MDDQIYETKNYGLETVLKRIMPDDYIPFVYDLKEDNPDFKTIDAQNPKYVAPILSKVNDYSPCELEDAKIILIEAIGASGKTELTKKMSHWLTCPIFDLGQTDVVGVNSLTGMIHKRMQRKDCFGYLDDIANGKSTMIIDALDEGYMKTNNQGYLAFLDDVLCLEPTKKCPLVLLGRYNAVELAAQFFFDKGIDFVTLQIEPFTLAKAKDFIDKAVDTEARHKYLPIYKETRDYILETINGFFKDQASMKDHASERFIGYAPVLMSIAKLFDEQINYKVVLDEMKNSNKQSVSLIVDIVQRILQRDLEEKVKPQLLKLLLADRDEAFKQLVMDTVYTPDEQCARVLYYVMGRPFPDVNLKDNAFLSSYNEHVKIWIEDHPFMGKHKIGNIVFESYILARLIHNPLYKKTAFDYMHQKGISYMFALIYNAMYKFTDVEGQVLPYIYESLRELNTKQNYYTFNLDHNPKLCDDIEVNCEFEFVGSNENLESYEGNVIYAKDDRIDLGRCIEHVNIDVPLDFILSRRNVEFVAPSYIKCENLIVESEEVTLYRSVEQTSIMVECNETLVYQKYDQYLQLVNSVKSRSIFNVVCPSQPEYPLIEHWISADDKLQDLSEEVIVRYKKLRAIILDFRSHSKHVLAKLSEKIDNIMGNNPVGQAVINALQEQKVMYREGHLYKLDTDIMDEILGLSYDGIRNFEMSEKAIDFLKNIEAE